jgi:hypothetical protein
MCAASSSVFAAEPAIPETPAGHALRDWLDSFNSGERARFERFHATYKPEDSVEEMLMFRRRVGDLVLVAVDASEARRIEFRVKEKSSPRVARGELELTDGTPPQIAAFGLQLIPPGMSAAEIAVKVDAAIRTRVLDGIAAKLTELYVFPETAKKMIEALRAKQQKGEYDAITSGYALATRLTHQLQSVSHDKHLRVQCLPMVLPKDDDRDPLAKPQIDDEDRAHLHRDNCGFVKVERLERNIGYVKLNMFGPAEVCAPTATAAMNFLAHVDAIIFDLRDNGGGDPDMVAWLSSYLFDKRTHLNDLWERKHNKTTEYWTKPEAPGPRLATQPVYVLTSGGTFSGAEEFTYNLKNLKRATIVGEVTGGGAHPTTGLRLDDHFLIGVPFARAINPISKTNWEGKGVEPDVKAHADEALEVAKKLAVAELDKRAPHGPLPPPPRKK